MGEKINNFIKKLIRKKEEKDELQPTEISRIMDISFVACIFSVMWFAYFIPLLIVIALLAYQYYLLNINNTYFKLNITKEKEKCRALEMKLEELDTDKRRAEIKTLSEEKEHLIELINETRKNLTDSRREYDKLLQEIDIKKAAIDAEMELERTKKQEQVKKEAQKISTCAVGK